MFRSLLLESIDILFHSLISISLSFLPKCLDLFINFFIYYTIISFYDITGRRSNGCCAVWHASKVRIMVPYLLFPLNVPLVLFSFFPLPFLPSRLSSISSPSRPFHTFPSLPSLTFLTSSYHHPHPFLYSFFFPSSLLLPFSISLHLLPSPLSPLRNGPIVLL